MTGRQTPLKTRSVPKDKEAFLPPASIKGSHPVYYRAVQVGQCLRRDDFKVGLRLAVLEQREQFQGSVPPPIFYTGVVERIWGSETDPLVTIKYDAHPYSVNITFGINQYHLICIPVPDKKPKAPTRRKTRAR